MWQHKQLLRIQIKINDARGKISLRKPIMLSRSRSGGLDSCELESFWSQPVHWLEWRRLWREISHWSKPCIQSTALSKVDNLPTLYVLALMVVNQWLWKCSHRGIITLLLHSGVPIVISDSGSNLRKCLFSWITVSSNSEQLLWALWQIHIHI